MNLLIFILIAYGMSNIVVHGKVFNTPRTWLSDRSKFLDGLLHCMMCFGAWSGFILSIIFFSPTLEYGPENIITKFNFFNIHPVAIFLDGLFSSGIVWLLHTIQEYFEFNTPQNEEED